MSLPKHGSLIEVVHVRTGEVKALEFVSASDNTVFLYWPLGAAAGVPFDGHTGGGGPEGASWMIADSGMKLLGVYPRRSFPLAYLKYREMVSAGRGETQLPPEKSRRRPPKVHPKQLPLVGQNNGTKGNAA